VSGIKTEKRLILIKWVVILLTVSLSTRCTRTVQKLNPQISYQKDLNITVNGHSFKGTALPKLSQKYKIEIESPTNLDLLTLESCHRHISIQNAFHKKRVIKNKKKYIYNFVPSPLEKDCFLEVKALSKKEAHSWGLIVFNSDEYTIPATVYCNGDKINYQGTSICQSKKDLDQQIIFKRKVAVEGNCPIVRAGLSNYKVYNLTIKEGFCVFIFRTEKEFHRLYTFGYDQIILRDI